MGLWFKQVIQQVGVICNSINKVCYYVFDGCENICKYFKIFFLNIDFENLLLRIILVNIYICDFIFVKIRKKIKVYIDCGILIYLCILSYVDFQFVLVGVRDVLEVNI